MPPHAPVTQKEFMFPDDATLMSTTDPTSRITYANDAFIEVSGFSREEVQGQPHNMVRHPDMPKAAFADMWATLKGGEPWTALVKNRRKNGDHYWVRANATPIIRNGRPAGYMSVRTKATREEIAGAEALYRQFREGTVGPRRFHKGLIVSTGLVAWKSALQTMSVRWRIRWSLLALWPCVVGAATCLHPMLANFGAFAGLTAAAVAAVAWWLEAQIVRPLEQVRAHALRVASGESQQAVQLDRVDEIGMLLRTVSQLGLMFRWLIDDVSAQVLNVQTASNEIAQGNHDLNNRTEQAAASVEKTVSSMSEMTHTVKSNAQTAQQANDLSGTASGAAARGGQAVSEVVATMNEITSSSQRIADIIGVIDGIAFQTNILALNAAVEAARAGDQGRGFAVVASEVRSLAKRSADAAKEIKSLIGASVEKVTVGSKLVDDAGKTMEEIVDQVQRVSSLIAEISSSTVEQTSGISRIGQAVGSIDEITQQNAALVEQSAVAAASLQLQATRLVEAVSVFR